MTMYSPHFSVGELACPHCGVITLQPGFLEALEELRENYGRSMTVTSGCRCVFHNKAIGGHPRSLHLIGNTAHRTDTCAVDVRMIDAALRANLVINALSLGFSIGMDKTFLHLDWRFRCTPLPIVTWPYD